MIWCKWFKGLGFNDQDILSVEFPPTPNKLSRIRDRFFIENDRSLYPDINAIAGMVRDGSIVVRVEEAIREIRV